MTNNEPTVIARHQIEQHLEAGDPIYEAFYNCYAQLRTAQSSAESRSELLALADWLREEVEQRIEEIVREDNV